MQRGVSPGRDVLAPRAVAREGEPPWCARFRVRTREGREFTPGSLAAFARLVDDGEISEEDLIYDALTGEWAPARAHPVSFMVDLGASTEEQPGLAPPRRPRARAEVRSDDGPSADLYLPLGLADAPSSDTVAAAFMARMQAERESDPSRPSADLNGLHVVLGNVDGSAAHFVSRANPVSVQPTPWVARPLSGSVGAEPVRGRSLWMVTVLMCVTAGVAAPSMRKMAEVTRVESCDRPALSVRTPHVSQLEEDTRVRTRAASLKEARSLVNQLGVTAIPDVWLSGAYLANAVAFPETKTAWRGYLDFVRAQRASGETTYREAYLAELEAEGIAGPLRSLRIAGAMRDFRA